MIIFLNFTTCFRKVQYYCSDTEGKKAQKKGLQIFLGAKGGSQRKRRMRTF